MQNFAGLLTSIALSIWCNCIPNAAIMFRERVFDRVNSVAQYVSLAEF